MSRIAFATLSDAALAWAVFCRTKPNRRWGYEIARRATKARNQTGSGQNAAFCSGTCLNAYFLRATDCLLLLLPIGLQQQTRSLSEGNMAKTNRSCDTESKNEGKYLLSQSGTNAKAIARQEERAASGMAYASLSLDLPSTLD